MVKILRNNEFIQKQSREMVSREVQDIALALMANHQLVDYYAIDPNLSESTYLGVETFIGEDSPVVYHKISNFPIFCNDDLTMVTEIGDESFLTTEYDASGTIFPQTIKPKGNDFFRIPGHDVLFRITSFTMNTVKSNPYYDIEFNIKSLYKEKIEALDKQVTKTFNFIVGDTATGGSTIIESDSFENRLKSIEGYADLYLMYVSLFREDESKSYFIFEPIVHGNDMYKLYDMILNKFMYDNEIVSFDNTINYRNNNTLKAPIPMVYIDEPMIDLYHYRVSWINKFINKDSTFDEKLVPSVERVGSEVERFVTSNMLLVQMYTNEFDSNVLEDGGFEILSMEEITRIKEGTILHDGNMVDILASYFTNQPITTEMFDNLIVEYTKSIKNFYLIPIILYIYRDVINRQ